MEQYIQKSAFAAVIEKLKRKIDDHDDYANGWHNALSSVETDISFLEAKDVDLEKDVRQIIDLYLEAGKYYDDVIKQERDLYGYSDLAIKLLDRIVDANEMSIQYVLDKLKPQKGE